MRFSRTKLLDLRNLLRWILEWTRFNKAFVSAHRLSLNKWFGNRLSPSSPLPAFPTPINSLIKTPSNFIWFIILFLRIIEFMITDCFIYSNMLIITLFLFLLTKCNKLVDIHLSLLIILFFILFNLFIFLIQAKNKIIDIRQVYLRNLMHIMVSIGNLKLFIFLIFRIMKLLTLELFFSDHL